MKSSIAYEKLAIVTEEMNPSPKPRYLPPNYNSFGQYPTLRDPFEINTVKVGLFMCIHYSILPNS